MFAHVNKTIIYWEWNKSDVQDKKNIQYIFFYAQDDQIKINGKNLFELLF